MPPGARNDHSSKAGSAISCWLRSWDKLYMLIQTYPLNSLGSAIPLGKLTGLIIPEEPGKVLAA